MLWSGKFDSQANPQTSIKSERQSIEEESRLVITATGDSEARAHGIGQADYELLAKLGEGGMGVVMSARQASIDRVVAIKKIKLAEADKVEFRQKFLAEAIVTGELEHPNIVPIYDLGKDDGGHALLRHETRQGHALGPGHREKTQCRRIWRFG